MDEMPEKMKGGNKSKVTQEELEVWQMKVMNQIKQLRTKDLSSLADSRLELKFTPKVKVKWDKSEPVSPLDVLEIENNQIKLKDLYSEEKREKTLQTDELADFLDKLAFSIGGSKDKLEKLSQFIENILPESKA